MSVAKYVFDTGPFIQLGMLDREVFVSAYAAVAAALSDGTITSCRAVFDEIDDKTGELKKWCAPNKAAFVRPSVAEQLLVREILTKYPVLIKPSDLQIGKQVADPFVIARGRHLGLTVVTNERWKPNAQKVPNVCQHYGVPSMDLMGFFKAEGLRF